VNEVVARFADGRMVKGLTNDFIAGKEQFHVAVVDAPPGSKPVEVQTKDLKAVFFVEDFTGNPRHRRRQEFDPKRPPSGPKIKVVSKDGELIVGTTQGYQPGRPGFFLVPADPESNAERCYVVAAAAREIAFL
jgi:hypothetical protein